MIYIERGDISKYYGISKNLDTTLKFLEKADLSSLIQGRNDVDADNVYINRFDYTTITEDEGFFEAHEFYADVHVLLSGQERIDVSDIKNLTETARDAETDFVGYKGITEATFKMDTSKILIVFPKEAHMVKLQLNGPVKVEKAVVKVKI